MVGETDSTAARATDALSTIGVGVGNTRVVDACCTVARDTVAIAGFAAAVCKWHGTVAPVADDHG